MLGRSTKNPVEDGLPDLYPNLWRFCVALTGDRAQGEDLVQATSLRALERSDQFKPGTHLAGWLFVMARRLWLNEIRAGRVRRGAGLVPVEDLDLQSEAPETETHIYAREVFNVMIGLPDAQRVTALLVLAEGFSYAAARRSVVERLGETRKRQRG